MASYAVVIVTLILLSIFTVVRMEESVVSYSSKQGLREDNGKKIMDEIMTRSKLPRYGECWTAALEDLKVACKIMDSDTQSKLAFAFTSCFVEMLGFPPYLCDKSSRIQECIKHLDQRGYNTFLEYFLHTQDMCFFLMNQVWQEETDRTVNNLASAAHGVTRHLEVSIHTQDKILESQQESLKVQANMVQDHNALYQTVLRVKQIFDEFRLSVDNHQQMFMGIFEKLEKMQLLVSWIQGEMSLLDMFGFYAAALFFGFLVTTPRWTTEARFPLIILVTTAFMVERFLYNRLLAHDYTPDEISLWLWYFRRGAVTVGLIVCIITGLSYRKVDSDIHGKLDKLMIMLMERNKLGGEVTKEVHPMEIEEDNSKSSDTGSDTSDFSRDSESSDSTSVEIDPSEADELRRDVILYSRNKENVPLGTKNSVYDDDLPRGPPVLTSTPKDQQASTSRYNLRVRKVTPNPIVNTESPKEFARKVMKTGSSGSFAGKRGNNLDRSSFFSSADEL